MPLYQSYTTWLKLRGIQFLFQKTFVVYMALEKIFSAKYSPKQMLKKCMVDRNSVLNTLLNFSATLKPVLNRTESFVYVICKPL